MTGAAHKIPQETPDQIPQHDALPGAHALTGSAAAVEPSDLRREIAERLATHRARRGSSSLAESAHPSPATSPRAARGRHASVAGAVAERYAQAQSYRSFLSAEAERSVRQAEAVAEVATINARAIANAQQQLLADFDEWEIPGPHAAATGLGEQPDAASLAADNLAAAAFAVAPPSLRTYTVRLPEDVPRPLDSAAGAILGRRREVPDEIDLEECSALDDEIRFRHAPAAEESRMEPLPLAANLIEFPRQLIAARRARPRLAEGPLRGDPNAADAQLRIFEVEAAQLAAESPSAIDDRAPEWSSILLASRPAESFTTVEGAAYALALIPQAAPISRRVMAALVDGTLILATLLAATGVFVETAVHLGSANPVLHVKPVTATLALAGSALLLAALYQALFFTFSDTTPGMRYARIALCTFAEENPTRRALRRRLLSMAVGALPLGLGLLWAFVDEDTLSWHDRLSRMYQRSY